MYLIKHIMAVRLRHTTTHSQKKPMYFSLKFPYFLVKFQDSVKLRRSFLISDTTKFSSNLQHQWFHLTKLFSTPPCHNLNLVFISILIFCLSSVPKSNLVCFFLGRSVILLGNEHKVGRAFLVSSNGFFQQIYLHIFINQIWWNGRLVDSHIDTSMLPRFEGFIFGQIFFKSVNLQ